MCDPLEFLATFLPSEERRLTRTGVQIHCLQYWADALDAWVGQGKDVRVHYDPRDVTFVYVRTPGGVLVKATVTTPNVPAISLAEWQARRSHERSFGRSPALVAVSDASSERSKQLVNEEKEKRKVQRRRATQAAGDAYRSESVPTTKRDVDARHAQSMNPPLITTNRTYFNVEVYRDDF